MASATWHRWPEVLADEDSYEKWGNQVFFLCPKLTQRKKDYYSFSSNHAVNDTLTSSSATQQNLKAINIHCKIYFLLFYVRENKQQGIDFSQSQAAWQRKRRKQTCPGHLSSHHAFVWPVLCSTHWHFWEASLKISKDRWKLHAPNCFPSDLIWRLSSILNKFKDWEREEGTAKLVLQNSRTSRDQRQPTQNLSPHYFSLLYTFLILVPFKY